MLLLTKRSIISRESFELFNNKYIVNKPTT